MIRKLRRRFIATAMLAVMLVLLFLISAINIVDFRTITSRADALLTVLAENNGVFPANMGPNGHHVYLNGVGAALEDFDDVSDNDFDEDDNQTLWNNPDSFTAETPYESRYFTVRLDADGNEESVNTGKIASIGSSEAVSIARQVKQIGKISGYYGWYRYRIVTDADGNQLFLFLDRSKDLSSAQNLMVVSMMTYILANLVIFGLIVLFSRRVFRPVEESYAKQKQFITNAGHELKTPLAIIDSCTEVLEMEGGESKWTDGIHEQVKRLATMTKDLVDLSRMDEADTELEKRTFDLSKAISDELQPFTLLAEEHGLTLNLNIDPDINSFYGSERTLKQLASILADNAVKYAVPGSTIDIRLRRTNRRRIHLTSYNAADSVTKGQHNELFDRFYRADQSRNSKTGGYGIGLSMARTIVESHSGRISAVSEDGEHLKITASLPEKNPPKNWGLGSRNKDGGADQPAAQT